jgi:hypothetical protein
MIDFSDDPKYNERVAVVQEKDLIYIKLYRGGELVYIGVLKDEQVGNETRDNGNENQRSGKASRD